VSLNPTERLLFYSDLDATLLEARTGSFEAAKPMIKKLEALGIPLILNSSRTAPEMLHLRREMNNRHPFAAEHGGAVCTPVGYFEGQKIPLDHEVKMDYLGLHYKSILHHLIELKDLHDFSFLGFDDMSIPDLTRETGLSLEVAIQAKHRLASEALVWLDRAELLDHFKATLAERGLRLVKGGRFYFVISERADKGGAVTWINFNYQAQDKSRPLKTVGIGDGPNDLDLLNQVDLPVVVAPPRGSRLAFDKPGTIFTEKSGPEGWAEGVEKALAQLGL